MGAGSRTSVALLLVIAVLVVVRFSVTELGDVVGANVKNQLEQAQERKKAKAAAAAAASEESPSGEPFLKGYGEAATIPQEDLMRLAHALDKFSPVMEGDPSWPPSSNEALSQALRGQNPLQIHYLPDSHPIFNAQGQIVDRWGTPLLFPMASGNKFDIRSAGPDKTMNTDDDLYRKHDGTFLRNVK